MPNLTNQPAPTEMREFTRACGHQQTVIWTIGDEAQAANYQSTGCSFCRSWRPAPKFGRGRGSNR